MKIHESKENVLKIKITANTAANLSWKRGWSQFILFLALWFDVLITSPKGVRSAVKWKKCKNEYF